MKNQYKQFNFDEVHLEDFQLKLIKDCLEALKIINKNLLMDRNGLKIIANNLIALAINFHPQLILKKNGLFKKEKNTIYCKIIIESKNREISNQQFQYMTKNFHKKNIIKAILMGLSDSYFVYFENNNNISISEPINYIGILNNFLHDFQNTDSFIRRLIGFLKD